MTASATPARPNAERPGPEGVAPLLLEPRPSRRLWGGSRLGPLLGTPAGDGEDPVGEAWLVYGGNRVRGGPWDGRTLQEVADALGPALVGTVAAERYGARVPLLAKLIDTAAPLSIQVHPDDAYALREEAAGGHLGKAEAWYVLEAAPGAEIVWGFARDVDAAEVREAVRDERLEELVRREPVAAGDVVYNPAGRVHAIGAGIFLFEIQQASDLTYRLYDYGRTDAAGRARELHVDRALDVADLRAGGEPKVPKRRVDGWTELVRTPHFVMETREVVDALAGATTPASFHTLTFVKGRGSVRPEAARHALPFAHDSVVLPAALGAYEVRGVGQLVRCRVPDDAAL